MPIPGIEHWATSRSKTPSADPGNGWSGEVLSPDWEPADEPSVHRLGRRALGRVELVEIARRLGERQAEVNAEVHRPAPVLTGQREAGFRARPWLSVRPTDPQRPDRRMRRRLRVGPGHRLPPVAARPQSPPPGVNAAPSRRAGKPFAGAFDAFQRGPLFRTRGGDGLGGAPGTGGGTSRTASRCGGSGGSDGSGGRMDCGIRTRVPRSGQRHHRPHRQRSHSQTQSRRWRRTSSGRRARRIFLTSTSWQWYWKGVGLIGELRPTPGAVPPGTAITERFRC